MKHVLVIEDNEINQELIKRRLEKRGFKVDIASDGESGLKLVQEIMPDLILLDISLPRMDGLEVVKTLKANPQLSRIPVIALTAHAMEGDRQKALQAGFDEYESKPVKIDQLLTKMEKLAA